MLLKRLIIEDGDVDTGQWDSIGATNREKPRGSIEAAIILTI